MSIIYIIRTANLVANDLPVYKIGRSTDIRKRMDSYEKGAEIYLHQWFGDGNIIQHEKVLIAQFTNLFTRRTDFGNEYFEGVIEDMISHVHKYWAKCAHVHSRLRRSVQESNLSGDTSDEKVILMRLAAAPGPVRVAFNFYATWEPEDKYFDSTGDRMYKVYKELKKQIGCEHENINQSKFLEIADTIFPLKKHGKKYKYTREYKFTLADLYTNISKYLGIKTHAIDLHSIIMTFLVDMYNINKK
ncbi:hypothetical protein F-E9_243 [Faustovirus]|nr:hypothetical protein F-E9_243 [Faustovirus]